MSIRNRAAKFIRKLNGKLDFLSVKQYYERNGWKVAMFSENTPIIQELMLQEKAKRVKGFVFADERVRYIFIRANLTLHEKRDVIFHEAGHIELDHMYSDLNEESKEHEAIEFANILIRNCRGENNIRKLLMCLYSIIAVLLILCSCLIFNAVIGSIRENPSVEISRLDLSGQDAESGNIIENNLQEVYVTPSGEKYHTANCQHIKYNPNKVKIDLQTAQKIYLPCLDCID